MKPTVTLQARIAAGLASTFVLLLAGCGINGGSSAQPDTVKAVVSGTAYGGSFPVIGANVTLWQTLSSGYPSSSNATAGTTSKILATATTGTLGDFSFPATAYTCTNGQYAYITVTGGHSPGQSATNNQSALMAALGACTAWNANASTDTNIYDHFNIFINEATTVAAAYALSNFIYDDGTAGAQKIYISAPANNNAATPACTAGYSMTCTANGLGHAFANASNLTNAISFTTFADGSVYSVAPSNAASSVPQALINSLANTLEYCINSPGTGNPGDAGHCSSLMGSATPPAGTAPGDTIQAAVNMAKYPTNNAATLFGYASSSSSFSPHLTAAPTDLSLAVVFTGTAVGSVTTAFGYPTYVALDNNDNVMLVAADAASATATQSGIAGLASNGATTFGASVNTSTSYKKPVQAATDNIGHVWLADVTSVSGALVGTIRGINTVDGTSYVNMTTTANTNPVTPALYTSTPAQVGPSGLTVDRGNDIWMCRAGGTAIFQFVYTAGSPATYSNALGTSTVPINTSSLATGCTDMEPDTNQNIWATAFNAKGYIGVVPIQSSTSLTYNSAASAAKSTNQATITSLSGTAINSGGYAFTPVNFGIVGLAPNPVTTIPITAISTNLNVLTGMSWTPGTPHFDGAGTLWFPNNATTGALYYVPNINNSNGSSTNNVPFSLLPCYLPAAATTCATTSPVSSAPVVQADSTGSLWIPSGVNGTLTQVIGTAAPTWPALYSGHPGVIPQ